MTKLSLGHKKSNLMFRISWAFTVSIYRKKISNHYWLSKLVKYCNTRALGCSRQDIVLILFITTAKGMGLEKEPKVPLGKHI